jgi:tetratricopeptide (TPR) repeat protein
MKIFCMISFLVFFLVKISYSQDELFYVSIQGTWDKNKAPSRAQFGGNNTLISNYFKSFAGILISGGDHVNGVGEITFKVTEEGQIDSIRFNTKIGQRYDLVVLNLLLSMNGKWKSGEIDGIKKSEEITLWINIYKEAKRDKTLEECIAKGKELVEKKEFDKALKFLDKALIYDRLSLKAIKLKVESLVALNQNEKACNLISDSKKYDSEYFSDIIIPNCSH